MASKKEKDSNAKKDWTDDKISSLVDILEANPCIWDVYYTGYTNRGIKEIIHGAYTEIAISFYANIPSIKLRKTAGGRKWDERWLNKKVPSVGRELTSYIIATGYTTTS